MNDSPFPPRPSLGTSPRPSLPARILGALLAAVVVVLGFMFSLVALAVVAVGGTLLAGWLWWKSRALRRALQAHPTSFEPASDDGGRIIEGEVIRDPAPNGQPLR